MSSAYALKLIIGVQSDNHYSNVFGGFILNSKTGQLLIKWFCFAPPEKII